MPTLPAVCRRALIFIAFLASSASTALAGGEPRLTAPGWEARHEAIIAEASAQPHADVVLLGDSITQGWLLHKPLWEAQFPGVTTVNAGVASDGVEHILWRVEHGEFDKVRPRVVVLMAGINNLAFTPPRTIADGLADVMAAVAKRSPDTVFLLLGVMPSGKDPDHKRRPKIKAVNDLLAKLADGNRIRYLDVGPALLEKDGTLLKATSFDFVHFTKSGYERWAAALAPALRPLISAGI